jgi:HPt (histidine-containing phosphotransfer) domain-containing protein
MFTIDQLAEYGADTKEGLSRCMNMTDFYLRLVGMVAKDEHLAQLKEAVAAGDLTAAFDAAHALKGVLANLALTPVLKPVSELTENLRARKEMDYAPLIAEAEREMDRLLAIIR